MRLTLLGTGIPQPSLTRWGPANHLSIGGDTVLFDTGNGCVRRLLGIGQDMADLDYVFLTHMHSDHTIDLAHVLITGWLRYRKAPYTIVGPLRTQDFVDRLIHAFEEDIRIRRLHERVGEDVMTPRVIEVGHGDVFERDGWRATAIEVEHGYVKPALGFVFEEDDRKLVISGDTNVSEAVIEAASDADLLLHEVMETQEHRSGAAPDGRDWHTVDREQLTVFRRRVVESHTCPHGLAEVGARSGVPRLVATHMHDVDEAWTRGVVAAEYRGAFTLGEDLMSFEV